uniref:Photosystem I assembly protein Ycf4 n=1 Tax=Lepocinclis ovum TaxID=86638 RepID=A0A3G3LLY7_9EUGL|nr:photosystem I assembly protein ycf4 [Lepocinclis ovum]AYQ93734.1 photosystem I assembly protein ycf4 [Lepocinclis ovum]
MKNDDKIFIEKIENEGKLNDIIISTIMFIGSLGFLIVGVSSYLKFNLVSILNAKEIIFFPQGITMCFYGLTGLLISSYQIVVLKFNVGEGYNEFNKRNGNITVYRKKFPWEKTNLNLIYTIDDVEAIRVEKNNTILNSKQTIFICLKGKKEIPVLQIRKPINLNELEKKASNLASFLQVPIKGI